MVARDDQNMRGAVRYWERNVDRLRRSDVDSSRIRGGSVYSNV